MNAVSTDFVDIVGVGINAADTIIPLPYFPALDSKVEIPSSEVKSGGQVLVDGNDTEAAAQAARWASEERIPVVGDIDNRYPGVEALLEHTDFAITSRNFPEILTGEADLLKALPKP